MTLEDFLSEWNNDSDTVLVHTSGSTGKPKPMMVEKILKLSVGQQIPQVDVVHQLRDFKLQEVSLAERARLR